MEVVAADARDVRHVDADAQQRQREREVATESSAQLGHASPAGVAPTVPQQRQQRQRQQHVQPRLQGRHRQIGQSPPVPRPDVLGVVGVRQPLAVVAVAEQIVAHDDQQARHDQAGSVAPPRSPILAEVVPHTEPGKAAEREQRAFGPRERGGAETGGSEQQRRSAVRAGTGQGHRQRHEQRELPGLQAAARGPHAEGGAGAEEAEGHPRGQAPRFETRQVEDPP